MAFPRTRLRRLRGSDAIRSMVRETSLHTSDLIMPMFLVSGEKVRKEISSMPGIANLSVDLAAEEARRYADLGIKSVLLFGIPDDKDDTGSSSWDENGIIQRGIKAIKDAAPTLNVIADLCFCEYTSHGHCGIIKDGDVDNDATLDTTVKQTISLAQAGADLLAPSGMIDGAVGVMRQALDETGFSNLPIMAYSAKFASAFYGPFREAAQCAPQFGDRRTYQMDPANIQEAMREIELDIEEGADIIMVKPAMAYMDVIREARNHFSLPLAAYNVSGEFAMVKAAAQNGWIDGDKISVELLYGLKRAGADIIISYFTEEIARRFEGGAVTY